MASINEADRQIISDLEALVVRSLFYDLAAVGSVEDGWFGVWSSGHFYPMQKAAEIGIAS